MTDLESDITGLAAHLRRRRLTRPQVVVDEGLRGSATERLVLDALDGRPRAPIGVGGQGDLAAAVELAERGQEADAFVAVGGGSVIDRVKLAVAVRSGLDPEAVSRLGKHQGLVRVPTTGAHRPFLAVAATTLGTGSERNGNAVVSDHPNRVLVSSPMLRPDVAVTDPALTRTLPARLVRSGIYEAVMRAVGPCAGSASTDGRADALAIATAQRLMALGSVVAVTGRAGEGVRAEVSALSGLSHASAMHRGREPFAFRAWYVAHEVATVADLGKVGGLLVATAPMWSRILDGAGCWGVAARLHALWAQLRAGPCRGLPADPADGARGVAEMLGLDVPPARPEPTLLSSRLVQRWGGEQPCFAPGNRSEIVRLSERIAAA